MTAVLNIRLGNIKADITAKNNRSHMVKFGDLLYRRLVTINCWRNVIFSAINELLPFGRNNFNIARTA